MFRSVILALAGALTSADARTSALTAPAPPMELRFDATTRLSVGCAMAKQSYVVGEPILIYLHLYNGTEQTISAFHTWGNVSLTRLGTSSGNADWGFTLDRESRPSSVSRAFGCLRPGGSYQSAFLIADVRDSPQPGSYRAQVHVTILRSLNDHTPVGEISPPAIDFTVVAPQWNAVEAGSHIFG